MIISVDCRDDLCLLNYRHQENENSSILTWSDARKKKKKTMKVECLLVILNFFQISLHKKNWDLCNFFIIQGKETTQKIVLYLSSHFLLVLLILENKKRCSVCTLFKDLSRENLSFALRDNLYLIASILISLFVYMFVLSLSVSRLARQNCSSMCRTTLIERTKLLDQDLQHIFRVKSIFHL